MKPFSDYPLFTLTGLAPDSHGGAALDFFIYDTLKIFLLLATIIYAVAIVIVGYLFNAIL